jgi:hypothetical protein
MIGISVIISILGLCGIITVAQFIRNKCKERSNGYVSGVSMQRLQDLHRLDDADDAFGGSGTLDSDADEDDDDGGIGVALDEIGSNESEVRKR